MSPGRIAVGRARAVRAVIALTAVSACLGAVAYAATRPEHRAQGLAESKPIGAAPQEGAGGTRGNGEEPLPQARLIEYPEATSTLAEPQFRFHVPPRSPRPSAPSALSAAPGQAERPRRFQCRLDGGEWRACSSPLRLGSLAPGAHAFAARAFTRSGRPGPSASYAWRRVEPPSAPAQPDPKPFSIELGGQLEELYPGFPPQPVPILITNPNPVPIEVTSLTVAIADDPPGCPAENFALAPSDASPTAPVAVPAGGSVSLPTAATSAPTIRMLNLAVDQDACQGVEVPLAFDGEAQG